MPGAQVRIYRRNSTWVVDTGGRTQPEMRHLVPYLPKTLHGLHYNYPDIASACAGGVSPQVLASGLSAYYTERPNGSGHIEVAEGTDQIGNAAYLALGEDIYKMVPIRKAGTSKAIRVMREKIRTDGERLMAGLKAQAEEEAMGILHRAEAAAAEIRAKEQAKTVNTFAVPNCFQGYPVKRLTGGLFALYRMAIMFQSYSHGERQWPVRASLTVPLWLPINSMPNPEQVHVDGSAGYNLPHVSSSISCMKIGERLATTETLEGFQRFAVQVARTLSVVNLASLLASDYANWPKELVDATPAGIKEWLGRYRGDMSAQAHAGSELPTEGAVIEGRATWTL